MHKNLFALVVWLTAITMLFTLPFGNLPTQTARAAEPVASTLARSPVSAPPQVAPAPPLDAPSSPLDILRGLSQEEYLRLYRGQPAWPEPLETGARMDEPGLHSTQPFPQAELLPERSLMLAAQMPEDSEALSRQRRLEEAHLHALAQLPTSPPSEPALPIAYPTPPLQPAAQPVIFSAANLPAPAPLPTAADGSGALTPGIDAALEEGGKISGRVTRASDGVPLESIHVVCSTADTNQFCGEALTDADGYYTIDSLPAGDYKILFQAYGEWIGDGEYVNEWYQDKPGFDSADILHLDAGQELTGIDGALAQFGSLSGTVTDALTGAPIPDVQVSIFGTTYQWSTTVTTSSDGTYTIANIIPPDSYWVRFWPPTSTFYLDQYYNGKTSSSTADLVSVAGDQSVTGIHGALVKGGKISGTITDASSGAIVPYAGVYAYNAGTGEIFTWASADQNGNYILDWLPAGTYKLYFTPDSSNNSGVVAEWYDNQHSLAAADPVTVSVEAITSGINAALDAGASISGRVTRNTDGAPISGIYIACYNAESLELAGSATSGAEGSYTIVGLPAGHYLLYFHPTEDYLGEWYQDEASWETADPVEVATAQALTGIDVVLVMSSKISGTVTSALTYDPLPNIYVSIFDSNGAVITAGYTDQDGSYSLGGLLDGSYKVFFEVMSWAVYPAPVVSEWYDNQTSFATATPVNIIQGQTYPGINAALESGGSISGRVTDSLTHAGLPDVEVCARTVTNWYVDCAFTQADGSYTLSGLAADTYRLEFMPSSTSFYSSIWYNSKPYFEQADPVIVPENTTVSGIDQALVQGGRISGTVTSSVTGEPQHDVSVAAFDRLTGDYIRSAYTDNSGAYTLGALPAGQVNVLFTPNGYANPGLVSEWYNDQHTQENANPVTVTTGVVTANINAALEAGGTITGRVIRASDGAPLAGAYVTAVTADSNIWMYQVMTDENGVYTLTGMNAGTWKINFQGGDDYTDEWYQDQRSFDTADSLSTSLGQTISGIDAALVLGGKISGTVTDAATHSPQANIYVSVRNTSTGSYFGATYTDTGGAYTINRLPAGQYQVYFEVSPWYTYPTPMSSEWYNDKRSLSTADLVSVAEGFTTGGINAALEAGASLSGSVIRASDGAPIPDVYVGCMTAVTQDWVGYSYTKTDGSYTIANLPAGSYVLYFSHPNYVFEYYQDQSSWTEATPLVVDFGDALTGLDAQLNQGGKISGRVTSEYNGEPLPDVQIMALDDAGIGRYAGTTDASGNFLSEPLPPGAYRIRYYPEGSGFTAEHILEWYKDQPTQSTADYIQVFEGLTTGGLDAALTRGGTISGVVTDADTGLGIPNIEVMAQISGYDTRYTFTDSTGAYAVKGLPAGNARVTFFTHDTPYIPELYNDHFFSTGQYDPVPVALNTTTAGINAGLKQGVRLSGTVNSDEDGLPLTDVYVNIYDASGASWGGDWTDGAFTSMGLPDGEYYVRYSIYQSADWISARTKAHLSEYGSDAGLLQNGDRITLKRLDGFDIVDLGAEGLELGSQVSGVVTAEGGAPLADVTVQACPLYFSSWTDCRSAATATDGTYTLIGMYAGRYSLTFYTADSPNPTARLYASQRYDGLPWYAEGDALRVPAHTDLLQINAELQAGGFINGVVTAEDTLAPLPSVEVDFFTTDGQYAGYAVTNLAGEYESPALPAGDYRLLFYPYGSSGVYAPEWYDNEISFDTADPVSLAAGGTVRHIDAALSQSSAAAGGVLRGRVTAADTGLPLAGAVIDGWYIDTYNDWHNYFYTTADSDGYYEITLSANTYIARFSPPPGSAYVMEWYDNRFTFEEAVPILISGGSTFTANAALNRGLTISGTLTNELTGQPIPNANVFYLDHSGGMVRGVRTDQNGLYTTEPLIPSTYYLVFEVSGYISESYNDREPYWGDPLSLTSTNLTGIDAALEPAALLAGRVSAVDGLEPVLSNLVLQSADNRSYWFTNNTTISARGEFVVEVPSGDYTLYTIPEDPYNQEYQGEYFDHVYTLAEATMLHLPSGTTKNKVWVGLDDSGGKISGRSTSISGDRAEFTSVVIYDADGQHIATAYADFYGYYTSPMLAAGSYRLLFIPWSLGPEYGTWLPEYYTDRYSLETALPVTVLSGQTTADVDVAFASGNYRFTQPGDTQDEGFGFYDIAVVLDAPSALDVILSVSFGGTATPGADYNPFGSEIVIPAGATTGTFRMDLLEDSLYEVDETVTLELWSNSYGLRGDPYTFVLTLEDNEPPVLLPAPSITSVSPDQSRNNVPVVLEIFGTNFAPGSLVQLNSGSAQFYPAVTYVSAGELNILLPAGLTPGVYDVSVQNPDGQLVIHPDAYQSLSPLDTDLMGLDYELWTSPTTVYEATSVQLGQVVSQIGGEAALTNVKVSFYLGDPGSGGTLIGTGTVASLAPDSQASTSGITWNTPAAGTYTLYAVLDPNDAVEEANEGNNQISRTIQVLEVPAEAPDLTPPEVNSFSANSGSRFTTVANISLAVSASDADPGRVSQVKFIEYVYNEGLGLWQEGQASNWLAYTTGAAYPWTLLPGAGARYLQAWVADAAGNVSLLPKQTWINYTPTSASLLAGQSHYYLFDLTTGAAFSLTVTPAAGDPDLYVWAPDFYVRPPWVSISASEPDWVSFAAPLSGMYVARVFGYSDAAYSLNYSAVLLSRPPGLDAATDSKTILTDPGLEPDAVPSEQRTVEAPTEIVDEYPFSLFIPLVTR